MEQRMQKRRRFIHTTTLEESLAEEAGQLRDQAEMLPAGAEREHLLRKAKQCDTASHITEWLNSPGLRQPT
jgi:hypothetical protein